jgi:hypothetical protein
MWWEHLDNLRARPEHVRRRIAFVSTTLVSLLIFSVWYSTRDLSSARSSLSITEVTEPLALVGKAFGGMKNETEEIAASFETQLIPFMNALATATAPASSEEGVVDPLLSEADILFSDEMYTESHDSFPLPEPPTPPAVTSPPSTASTTIIN